MKFTQYEKWIIENAVEEYIDRAEDTVVKFKKEGTNLIYSPGYFTMIGKELLEKLEKLTYKNRKK